MVEDGKLLKIGFVAVLAIALVVIAFMATSIAGQPTYAARQASCTGQTCAAQQLQAAGQQVGTTQQQPQVVSIHAGPYGYNQPTVTVNAGQPVKLEFSADSNAGCGRELLMRDFGVNLVSQNGETSSATFTPTAGQYSFNCPMNMFRGVMVAR